MVTTAELQLLVSMRDSASQVLGGLNQNLKGTSTEATAAGGKIDQLRGHLSNLQSSIGGLLGPIASMGIGIAAAFEFKHAIGAAQDLGAQVKKLQTELGGTSEDASKLAFQLEASGVGFEKGEAGLRKFTRSLSGLADLEDGVVIPVGKAMVSNLEALGVRVQDTNGKLLPTSEILAGLADKFKTMPDGLEKTALATTMFGRAGAELIPFLNKGRAGLEEMSTEAKKFGLVLDQNTTDALFRQKAEMREFHEALRGIEVQIGLAVMPVVIAFTHAGIDLATELNSLIGSVGEFVAVARDLGGEVLTQATEQVTALGEAFQTFLSPTIIQLTQWLQDWLPILQEWVEKQDALMAVVEATQGPLMAIGEAVQGFFTGMTAGSVVLTVFTASLVTILALFTAYKVATIAAMVVEDAWIATKAVGTALIWLFNTALQREAETAAAGAAALGANAVATGVVGASAGAATPEVAALSVALGGVGPAGVAAGAGGAAAGAGIGTVALAAVGAIAGIAALGGVVYELQKHWESMGRAAMIASGVLLAMGSPIAGLVTGVTTLAGGIHLLTDLFGSSSDQMSEEDRQLQSLMRAANAAGLGLAYTGQSASSMANAFALASAQTVVLDGALRRALDTMAAAPAVAAKAKEFVGGMWQMPGAFPGQYISESGVATYYTGFATAIEKAAGGGGGVAKVAENLGKGFADGIAKGLTDAHLETVFGTEGAKVYDAFHTALIERTTASGAALAVAVQDLIKQARLDNVPNAEALGNDLIAAIGMGLDTGDYSGVEAALARLTEAMGIGGKASGESFVKGFNEAMQAEALAERIGSTGSQILAALNKAIVEGTPANEKALVGLVAGLQKQLKGKETKEVAAFFGAQLVETVRKAIDDHSPEALAALDRLLEGINKVLEGGAVDVHTGTVYIAEDVEKMAKKLGLSKDEVVKNFQVLIDSGIVAMLNAVKTVPKEMQAVIDAVLAILDNGAATAEEKLNALNRLKNLAAGGSGGGTLFKPGTTGGAAGSGTFNGIPTNMLYNESIGPGGQATIENVSSLEGITTGNGILWGMIMNGVATGMITASMLPPNLVAAVNSMYANVGGPPSTFNNVGTSRVVVPGLAEGIEYVPYDNYLARLHLGERVLTARENAALGDVDLGGMPVVAAPYREPTFSTATVDTPGTEPVPELHVHLPSGGFYVRSLEELAADLQEVWDRRVRR